MPGSEEAVLQAGVSVSNRHFKRAVDRNRIKRLMRESYRLQKNSLFESLKASGKGMVVFIIYTGKEVPPYQEVYQATTTIIKKLIRQINAVGQANP